MARIGSTKIAKAFTSGNTARTNNTYTDGTAVWLHGNKIMWANGEGEVHFNMCGWASVVTKDRLNHLFHHLNVPLRICNIKRSPHVYHIRTHQKCEISSRLDYSVNDFSELGTDQ